ncbi:hypothetical protein JOF40_001192 [Aeromicrobium fastidiosum]|nr:hypothetical protein [Aeromicrobium fastidiosum]
MSMAHSLRRLQRRLRCKIKYGTACPHRPKHR